MPRWLESLTAAIGGSAVSLVVILTVFKGLFVKLFETGIETSFEKKFEKFRNNLYRATRAYEILLDREMRYYERLDIIIAELVPLEHDLLYYLKYDENVDLDKKWNEFREHFMRYCKLTIELKNETLIHGLYVPDEITYEFSNLVKQMQNDIQLWGRMGRFANDGEYDEIDYHECEKVKEMFFLRLAVGQIKVRKRLRKLSGEIESQRTVN